MTQTKHWRAGKIHTPLNADEMEYSTIGLDWDDGIICAWSAVLIWNGNQNI